jgi:hypothetical protein
MYRAELKVLGPLLEPSLGEDAIPLSEITYRSLLARVMDSIGDQITSAEELNQYMRPRLKGYLGAFPASAEPPLKDGECAIVNTHDAPGEHWTAIATIDGETVLFDSLGGGDTDPDRDQYLPNNCGAHCCAWLLLWKQDPEMALEI